MFGVGVLARANEHGNQTDDGRAEGEETCPEEEIDEIFNVAITNAVANPWTMVVMYFNTDLALTAVESPWWPQEFARPAITHLVVSLALINSTYISLHVVRQLEVFEFIHVIEPFNWLFYAQIVHGLIQLLPRLVFNIIISLTVRLLSLPVRHASV